MAKKCDHPESTAFESYRKSPKNWNGYVKCLKCHRTRFEPAVKLWLDTKNGVVHRSAHGIPDHIL